MYVCLSHSNNKKCIGIGKPKRESLRKLSGENVFPCCCRRRVVVAQLSSSSPFTALVQFVSFLRFRWSHSLLYYIETSRCICIRLYSTNTICSFLYISRALYVHNTNYSQLNYLRSVCIFFFVIIIVQATIFLFRIWLAFTERSTQIAFLLWNEDGAKDDTHAHNWRRR